MAGYQVDTFQYTLLNNIRQIVRRGVIANKTGATSFFISCAKCLWDAVGHFLGCRAQPLEARSAGPRGTLSLAGSRVTFKYFKYLQKA
ncbi:hypothetical protein [Pseudomonas sp. LB3P14]